MTAIETAQGWTIADNAGGRFWPTKPCKTAKAAMAAMKRGAGVWRS